MSFLGNNVAFEWFNLKDMLGKAKDDPEALLLGGMDPAGAELWKGLGVLDKDFEPAVNIWGGPMGGGTLGTDKEGGVYGRAGAEGIDTSDAAGAHTVAEAIAQMYAMQGLGGQFGKFTGTGDAGSQAFQQAPGLLGGGQTTAPTTNSSQQAEAEARRRRSLLNFRLA